VKVRIVSLCPAALPFGSGCWAMVISPSTHQSGCATVWAEVLADVAGVTGVELVGTLELVAVADGVVAGVVAVPDPAGDPVPAFDEPHAAKPNVASTATPAMSTRARSCMTIPPGVGRTVLNSAEYCRILQ